ncbi:hypothetical protein [Paraburkholderia sp.]|uniref:hypothetical protein n=1 Tax=Paraburkholderia sp. TaxID=1926495 RepID=UPI003C7A7F34
MAGVRRGRCFEAARHNRIAGNRHGLKVRTVIFSFSCGVCVLALAPQLPMEFETFRMGFYLSATECVLKSCVLLTLALHDWPTRALHFDVLNDGLQEGLHVARKTI